MIDAVVLSVSWLISDRIEIVVRNEGKLLQ